MEWDEERADRRLELAVTCDVSPPVTVSMAIRLRRSSRTLWRSVHDGVLLLEPGADCVTLLSGSGAMLWHVLAEPVTEEELWEELARLYDTDAATVRDSARAALAQLCATGAVEQVKAAG